jgi:predicted ferric reductase
VLTYPDVLMATVGLGLFVLVGVTSARAARKRLRYETWHLLHLYTYLAVALSFAHEFATGADFTDARVRVLWAGLYIVVGSLLIWYRLVTPLVNLARHTLRVVAVVPHRRGVVSVVLGGRNLDRLDARAGQFFRWRFLNRELWSAANPYSLSAAPRSDQLRITVKTAGTHSAALGRLRPGTRVLAEGPYGAFTGDHEERSAVGRRTGKVLLIGVGIGITPVRSLFESIAAAPGGLTLLYRARTARDLVLRDEIEHIAHARGARVHYLVGSRRSQGHLSVAQLSRLVPDLAEHEVYLCGPDMLVGGLARDLRRAGVTRSAIHFESFTF